ncbi:Ca2+:H+ antiporter [Geosmithia morbida]|uniref:Ca2+:H+ antiporter n=1 Tax=Geosmithia morbida TaxID=1094350 RepID=A0A9P5CXN9_9HYPO|nr:Ca2+:H+ antiporter [Geosmithia morbida]KAF4119493.1 Ca2+:H+ antiporter [Geosmithia morbida]
MGPSRPEDQAGEEQQQPPSQQPSQQSTPSLSGSQDAARLRPEGYGSIQNPTPSGSRTPQPPTTPRPSGTRPTQPPASPQIPSYNRSASYSRSRKPPLTRRMSTKTPHRGAVFSADDDQDEVEADVVAEIMRERDANPGYSTGRRRPAAPPSLSHVHSREPEADSRQADNEVREQETSAGDDDNHDGDDDLDEDEELDLEDHLDCDSDSDISEAESFTLKDRQQAINQTHPFGIRVWKPALYKKDRSIQASAQADIHSSPGGHVSNWLLLFNLVWSLVFGWWMALLAAIGAVVCLLFAASPSGREYGRVLWGLATYLLYPFGRLVRLELDEAYLDEDRDQGRSVSEYEQWQQGDLEYGRLFFGPDNSAPTQRSIVGRSRRSIDSDASETDGLLGRTWRGQSGGSDEGPKTKRRLFGRGEWNVGRVIFFVFFYFLITPSLLVVSVICWFLVFWIPMGKLTMLLFDHLRRHPLALSFETDAGYPRSRHAPDSTILLCTYRAVGSKYWKYTIDGTNIFLINLMAVVIFVIFDWLVLDRLLDVDSPVTSPAFLFCGGLLSIIPLAYFIGQAVASISAQSSMGLGAAINAFFATIVEVFLYCVALTQGKAPLVEGSIIGSIFAGVLLLPGISMCFGALKRKTQRFNARSAGVTSTMLLFAAVGAFSPTLFYQIYGTHELNCLDCDDYPVDDVDTGRGGARDCRRCYFSQEPALNDRFYLEAVRPYCFLAATMLFLSYLIGLWFTLRTHAAVIWNAEVEEKRHEEHLQHHSHHHQQQQPQQHAQAAVARLPGPAGQPSHQAQTPAGAAGESTGSDIRDSNVYRRILGYSLKQAGLPHSSAEAVAARAAAGSQDPNGGAPIPTPHVVPPKDGDEAATATAARSKYQVPGLSEAESSSLIRQFTEIAATAATYVSREQREQRTARKPSNVHQAPLASSNRAPSKAGANEENESSAAEVTAAAQGGGHGGHDAPNWSRTKSSVILLGATILYAIIAEILVDTVDVVLESVAIDQKFLGITLFALVPNTTEFLNAISFAMNGNIALSMEIGSAYALQVCLLQIPCLVLFTALYTGIPAGADVGMYSFTLLFPQWDMVTTILCVFLLSYVYSEGKSNYFKGSILVLTYLVVIIGFWFSGYMSDAMGVERFDVMGADGRYIAAGRQDFRTIGRGTSGRAFSV